MFGAQHNQWTVLSSLTQYLASACLSGTMVPSACILQARGKWRCLRILLYKLILPSGTATFDIMNTSPISLSIFRSTSLQILNAALHSCLSVASTPMKTKSCVHSKLSTTHTLNPFPSSFLDAPKSSKETSIPRLLALKPQCLPQITSLAKSAACRQ